MPDRPKYPARRLSCTSKPRSSSSMRITNCVLLAETRFRLVIRRPCACGAHSMRTGNMFLQAAGCAGDRCPLHGHTSQVYRCVSRRLQIKVERTENSLMIKASRACPKMLLQLYVGRRWQFKYAKISCDLCHRISAFPRVGSRVSVTKMRLKRSRRFSAVFVQSERVT